MQFRGELYLIIEVELRDKLPTPNCVTVFD